MDKKNIKKEAIIAEYLIGGITYRKLSAKYGITFQSIHQWVQAFQGKKTLKKLDGLHPTYNKLLCRSGDLSLASCSSALLTSV